MLANNFFRSMIGASESVATDTVFILGFAIASIAVVLVFVWLLSRFLGKKPVLTAENNIANISADGASLSSSKGGKFNFAALLAVTLIIGVVVRLIFTSIVRGYRPEYNQITDFMQYIKDNGFASSFYMAKGVTFYPITYYIFSAMGALANLFGIGADSYIMSLFVKLPFIICDILTALLLYKIAKKYINNEVALIVAAFICICPIFVLSSGVWGSMYSILTLGLVLSMYFLLQKNFAALIATYGAAMLINKEAIFLFPLVAVFVVYSFIKALKATLAAKPSSATEVFKSKELAPVAIIPISIVVTGLIMYIISLPMLINSFGGSFFGYIFQLFLKPFDMLTSFGRNSLSIFNLFMRNGIAIDSSFPSVMFAVIFGVIILGIVLLIYLSKKNRANLIYLAAYIIITLATYFVNFTELSLLPAIGILLFAFLLIRDKRILQILGVLSIVMVINASVVLASAGFINNLEEYFVSGDTYTYTNLILSGAAGVATSIICSVLTILAHFYATLVLLDVSMSNKRKFLVENPNVKFLKSIANFVKIK